MSFSTFSFARLFLYSIVALTLLFPSVKAWDECTNPRVRKEYRTLSDEERTEWLTAISCLMDMPHSDALTPSVNPNMSQIPAVNTSGSYYDDFVYIHMDLNIKIHFTGYFLPWHRWYIQAYDDALRGFCNYTGPTPYWNWSTDASDIKTSPIFDPNTTSGLGTWGTQENDYSITDGVFSDKMLAYPVPHILRRNYTLQPYVNDPRPFVPNPDIDANVTITNDEMQKLINGYQGDYRGFQAYFEFFGGAHASVHELLGGDFPGLCPEDLGPPECIAGPKWSANEPVFWLHHGMVDKVWYDWQNANETNFWAYYGGSTQAISDWDWYEEYPNGAPPMLNTSSLVPTDGMFTEVTIEDVLNTTGGYLCYVYE